MTAIAPITTPPTYDTVASRVRDERVVLRNGREVNVGGVFPVTDDAGNIMTYGEVRAGNEMWVNVTTIAKTEGKTWSHWYELKGTKSLIESIEKAKGNTRNPVGSPQLVDKTRFHYKGPEADKLRGTWVHADVAVAFAQHISPTYHAKWCAIQGKVLAGDHAAVADVLTETDRAAGTVSEAAVRTRKRTSGDDTPSATKHVRMELPPTDVRYWMAKRNGGYDFDEAIRRINAAIDVQMRIAVMDNPEALAAVKRAEEAERTEQAKRDTIDRETARVIAEEQAKRDTIDKEMESARATVQSLRAMHADLQGLNDVRFLAWRQLNINRSILAAAGPCVYALFAQGYVKIGHTGTSLFERYKRDLWSHDMKELILICIPHKHKDEAYRHERLIHTQLKQIRCRVGNALEKLAMDFGRVSDAFKAVYGEEDIKFV